MTEAEIRADEREKCRQIVLEHLESYSLSGAVDDAARLLIATSRGLIGRISFALTQEGRRTSLPKSSSDGDL